MNGNIELNSSEEASITCVLLKSNSQFVCRRIWYITISIPIYFIP